MRLPLVVGFVALVGCHSDSSSGPDAYALTYDCADDPRSETYTVGFEKMGVNGLIDVKLQSASPAPPARGNNTWTIELSSMSNGVVGAPMDGMSADIAVTPYMPDHGHGTPILVEVAPVDGQPGTYSLDPLNLWMPGMWQNTIAVNLGSASDKVVYDFCLPD
ncbi:MAG TPA: FixH family protein [Kofleriaceae bacterium]|jgi:hypothetical protein